MCPFCAKTTSMMHVRYISNRFRSSSGSSFSVNAVESTISQKRTVSCRRSAPCGSACSIVVGSGAGNSRGREAASSGVPHSPQNLNEGFKNPQFAQSLCCIRRLLAYVVRPVMGMILRITVILVQWLSWLITRII